MSMTNLLNQSGSANTNAIMDQTYYSNFSNFSTTILINQMII